MWDANHSMPIGGAELFPEPPHAYRGVEDLLIEYDASAAPMLPMLPPGLEPDGDPVRCWAKFRWVPWSVHGPYHEVYVAVAVRFEGRRYRFIPLAYTDNEVPLVAGREVWGYPKKLARITLDWRGAGAEYGEMLTARVERPHTVGLLSGGLVCDRAADPEELDGPPALSLKLIPSAQGGQPDVARLIGLEGRSRFLKGTAGEPFLFAGRASLWMEAHSQTDPLWRFKPVSVARGYFMKTDFEHEHGRVVHDYLESPPKSG